MTNLFKFQCTGSDDTGSALIFKTDDCYCTTAVEQFRVFLQSLGYSECTVNSTFVEVGCAGLEEKVDD